MNIENLQAEYKDNLGILERFSDSLCSELMTLISESGVTLAVPVERRIKTFESIIGKSERKSKDIGSVFDFDDLIGMRVILLFHDDVEKVEDLVSNKFKVLQKENTGERLKENQFGYDSRHFTIKMPSTWLQVPSFSNFKSFRAELQVRTLAQHMWAVASHKLQYKTEESVPKSLRRAIHRASALLEMVDLEFNRVLKEREMYVGSILDSSNENTLLDVDRLARILNDNLPPENKDLDEDYADLLQDLASVNIRTANDLRELIEENAWVAIKEDKRMTGFQNVNSRDNERTARGVYFTHCGLVRLMLDYVFGHAKMAAIYSLHDTGWDNDAWDDDTDFQIEFVRDE